MKEWGEFGKGEDHKRNEFLVFQCNIKPKCNNNSMNCVYFEYNSITQISNYSFPQVHAH